MEVNNFQMEVKDPEFWSAEVFYPKGTPMTILFFMTILYMERVI